MITEIIQWYREQQDQKHVKKIIVNAFADHRFVMIFEVRGRIQRVCFTPTYAETKQFVDLYIVPMVVNHSGFLHRNSWKQDWGMIEYLRWSEILSLKIYTCLDTHKNLIQDIINESVMEYKNQQGFWFEKKED